MCKSLCIYQIKLDDDTIVSINHLRQMSLKRQEMKLLLFMHYVKDELKMKDSLIVMSKCDYIMVNDEVLIRPVNDKDEISNRTYVYGKGIIKSIKKCKEDGLYEYEVIFDLEKDKKVLGFRLGKQDFDYFKNPYELFNFEHNKTLRKKDEKKYNEYVRSNLWIYYNALLIQLKNAANIDKGVNYQKEDNIAKNYKLHGISVYIAMKMYLEKYFKEKSKNYYVSYPNVFVKKLDNREYDLILLKNKTHNNIFIDKENVKIYFELKSIDYFNENFNNYLKQFSKPLIYFSLFSRDKNRELVDNENKLAIIFGIIGKQSEYLQLPDYLLSDSLDNFLNN